MKRAGYLTCESSLSLTPDRTKAHDLRAFANSECRGKLIPDDEYEIHHTKYEGATYYGGQIACSSAITSRRIAC